MDFSFDNHRQAEVLKADKSIMYYNGRKYYYKPNRHNIELVIEIIAKRLNIKTANYTSHNIMGVPYYFSEDLNLKGEFITAEKLGLEGECLPEAFDLFNKKYPEYFNSLSHDLTKVYIMDIILMNPDRNNENWGIITTNNIPRICILDNELSFSLPAISLSSKRKEPYYIRKYFEDVSFSEDAYSDIKYFLENYSYHSIATFKVLLGMLTPEYIISLFDYVEKEYEVRIKDRDLFIKKYKEHYHRLQEILKEQTLGRKK